MTRGVMVAAPSANICWIYIDDGRADDSGAYLEGRSGSNGKENVAMVFGLSDGLVPGLWFVVMWV